MTLTGAPGRPDEDRATMSRLASGDTAAMAHLYDRHARPVYSLALRILADPGEAEDVVQDVFTQAWRQAQSYEASRAPVAGWLLMIARTRALDRLRKRRARGGPAVAHPNGADLADPTPGHDAHVIAHEDGARMRSALQGLSEGQREAIGLAYYQGLSQSEIAQQLQQPLGTVKTRIRSALLKLRETLSTDPSGPPR